MSFVLGTSILAVVTALACALPGVFIVLRKNSMLVDAISHAVFPGIVVGYLFSRDLDSPILIAGAALAGLLVVLGSEWLSRTGLITGDAPQGLIFPALFSIGVILITMNFSNVHLDTHTVLVGDLNLASFEQFAVQGIPVAPVYLVLMLGMLALNVVFIAALYPRLAVSTFDPEFARSLGVRTGVLNAGLMLLVAVTVTAAFNAAGAILVVALVIAPPATALLVTRGLPAMIALTLAIAAFGAIVGFWIAYWLDAPTSASMAIWYGVMFLATLVVSGGARRRGARSGVDSAIHQRHPHRIGGGATQGN
ncbi:metal ABC transporter permease [Leucobacter sp. W1038]|uniref:metal ABC transporter permease n=1 Tax=Leucobacter sp. W1038 TaxID=3438281 RepID=UPI003D95809B